MGRNKIVYGLSEVTLVVCTDMGTGGTWEGAKEANRRRFGTVAVWRGDGEGPGNEKLEALGATPIHSMSELLRCNRVEPGQAPTQSTLFD